MLNLGVDSLIKPENEPEELSELREKFFSWYTIENCDKLKDLNNLPEEHMNLLFMMAHKDEINAVLKKYNVTASPNGYFYSKAKESIMGGLMRKIYNERVEAKNIGKKYEKAYMESKNPEDLSLSQTYDLQQYVLKILINSVYGSLSMDINAFSHGKGYSTAVTTGSRTSNRWANHIISEGIAKINKTANENGYEYSVQCDTDSGYINISSLMNKKLATMGEDVSLDTKLDLANKICDKIIQPMIDSAIKDVCTLLNAYDADVLDMEKETVADKFVSTGDKRYYCRYYKKEKDGTLTAKHKITGLALISKATPPFCKEKLRPVLDIILDEEPTVLVDYIEKVREEFEHAPIEEISIIKGLSSIDYPLKGYKRLSEKKDKNGRVKTLTAPIHSRGALIFNEIIERSKYNYGKIRAGDKVYYAMLNTPNKEAFNQNVIAYINPKFMTDSNMLKNIDYQTMFDKNFLKNITLITEPIGWSLNKYQGLSDEWY
jgi:DNA polymerase elongation subunit (family B)